MYNSHENKVVEYVAAKQPVECCGAVSAHAIPQAKPQYQYQSQTQTKVYVAQIPPRIAKSALCVALIWQKIQHHRRPTRSEPSAHVV